MMAWPPLRRARHEATTIVKSLKRMAKADDRSIYGVAIASGISTSAANSWPNQTLPTLTSTIAFANALGYELVLRRKTGAEE